MSDQPLVSIIINNYNDESFFSATIDSALLQSYQPLEVIVVDDGSTDNSFSIIQSYGERITALFKPNGSQASALNAGFRQSHGVLAIFLDADDMLLPYIAAQVVACFTQRPTTTMIQYRLELVDAAGSRTRRNAFAMGALNELFPVPEGLLQSGLDRALSRVR